MAPVQAFADILREAFPDRRGIIQEGTPGVGYKPGYASLTPQSIDSSKAVKATGQAWTPFETTVLDTAKAYEKLL